jgi:hypothetical protein
MYFFRASKLADDLREGRVGEKERFKYYLAMLIGWSLIGQLFYSSGTTFNTKESISVTANPATIVIATILCYLLNKRGDNTDFIPRMICLGWPVGILIASISSAMFLSLCTSVLSR